MYYLSILIIALSFLMGLLETLFNLSPSYSGLLIDLTVVILFIVVLLKGRAAHFPYISYILLFIVVSLVSNFINQGSYIQLILGWKRYVLPLLFIYVIANIRISERRFMQFNKLLYTLLIIQIPFAFIKLSIYGFANESQLIGTIANSGGSTSSVLPMLGASFLITLYLYKHKKFYLLLILGMLFFGIVGGKRAVIFYVPISLAITYIIFKYFVQSDKRIITLFNNPIAILSWVVIFILIVYTGVRLSPSLNPENRIGGSFDLGYTYDYISNYESRNDYNSNQKYQLEGSGRMNAFSASLSYLTSKEGFIPILLGIGPGSLERSIVNYKNDVLFEDLGLGYGVSIVGLNRTLVQFGIIALILLLIFYYKINRIFVIAAIKNSTVNQKYFVIALSWSILLILDFATYSQAILSTRAFYLSLFFLIGYAINIFYQKQINSRTVKG